MKIFSVSLGATTVKVTEKFEAYKGEIAIINTIKCKKYI